MGIIIMGFLFPFHPIPFVSMAANLVGRMICTVTGSNCPDSIETLRKFLDLSLSTAWLARDFKKKSTKGGIKADI
jgi:hypothetical protein